MDVVAEGVETEFEAAMMTNFGCTELQGYHFSKPVNADAMAELLRTYQVGRPMPEPMPVATAG